MVTSSETSSSSGPKAIAVAQARRQGYIVLGMHRSGTSSVSGTLVKLGLAAPKNLMAGRPDNPRGHWESEVLASFHDELLASAGTRWDDWRAFREAWYDTPVAADFKARGKSLLRQEFGTSVAFVLKDPRICRFLRFWLDIFAEEGIEPKIVIPFRSPLEVARSHRRRNGFPLQKGLLLWLRHVLDAEAASRDLPRGLFQWRDFLQDWQMVAKRLETSLGSPWPAMTDYSALQVDRFLSLDLRHERASDTELAAHPELHAWVVEAFEALSELARNPASNSARATLDQLKQRFDDSASFFGAAMIAIEAGIADAETALHDERQAADRELTDLRQELQAAADRERHARVVIKAMEEHEAGLADQVSRLTALLDEAHASREADLVAKDAALQALSAERDAKLAEIAHLMQMLDTASTEAGRTEAAVRTEFEALLAAEREAREADKAVHAAAIDAIAVERDAKVQEILNLRQLIEANSAAVEEERARLHHDFQAMLESEREARAADLAVHAAALDARAAERDAKVQEVANLRQVIESTSAAAEEERVRLHREFQAMLESEREARSASEAAQDAALEAAHAEAAARIEEIDRLQQATEAAKVAAAEELADLRREFEATLARERAAREGEREASLTAYEVELEALKQEASRANEAHARLQKKLEEGQSLAHVERRLQQAKHLADIEELAAAKRALEQAVQELRTSRSWRVTAPMRFMVNVARGTTASRIGWGVRGLVTGRWGALYQGLRRVGHGIAPKVASIPVSAPASSVAIPAVQAIPAVPNNRNYWLPQALRDYLMEAHGPAEVAEVTTLMDLVSAYGEADGVFDRSAELSALLPWLKKLSAERAPSGQPDVSIIIPVFNKLVLTFVAIAAILRTPSRYSVEILVADDASTDETPAVFGGIGGCIRHIRNDRNYRFLMNCNRAAAEARGRFVVFLNNDTLALPGWLDNLIEPLNDSPDVGMTGSKLINGNGTLQEAGGILWRDGSAWNFGRNQDPRLPEFNYRKEVDYISGASIALPATVWRDLGGFDRHFEPAYCEDSDLAFRVRQAGLKVVFAPRSAIIHHEGMSHGRDTSHGMKAYQVSNMRKFAERWSEVLQAEHFPNGERVTLARDRSRNRPHILVVDHYVPEWDRDAGSRVMLDCIKFFVRCGFSVTFWPDNLNRSQPYTSILQDLGVEVIYGRQFVDSFDSWWANHHADYPYVLLSRCHIASRYIEMINAVGDATVLYYGVDIAWRRMLLEHAATGLDSLPAEAEVAKQLEDGVCAKSDYIIYLSREECDYARDNFPDAKGIIEMPGWVYDEDHFRSAEQAIDVIPENESCRVLFVGGFAHGPNGDGVRWFLDQVAPLVREREPRLVTVIVGSHMPKDISARAGEHIEIMGWASDEELAVLTKNAACTIAPLRFGAGVKGKVVSALASGSPVVSTSVGMQGLEAADEIAFVGDTA